MERADEGVVGGVGMVILGLVWSEVCVVAVEDKLEDEEPGLRVEGEEGLGFAVAGLLVRDGSMALPPAHQFVLDHESVKALEKYRSAIPCPKSFFPFAFVEIRLSAFLNKGSLR